MIQNSTKSITTTVPLFIHIPKTGGTYLGQLESNAQPVISPVQSLGHICVVDSNRKSPPVFPPKDGITHTVTLQEISNSFIFAVVRNIFDWLVSYASHSGGWNPKYHDIYHYDYKIAQKGFDYLVKTIADREDIWPCRKFIFFQLFCDNGALISDRILRTETLDSDLEELALDLGLQYQKRPKQRLGKRNDYRSYYTNSLIELVYNTWGRELDLYGYSFDGLDISSAVLKKNIDEKTKKNIVYYWETDQLLIGGTPKSSADITPISISTRKQKPCKLNLKYVKSENSTISPAFLQELKDLFNIKTFVETGTFSGDTAEIASTIFDKVYTIETSEDIFKRASNRFANTRNIHTEHGDSAEVLPKILKKVKGKTLFWLDAQYREGIIAREKSNTSIMDALRAIKDAGIQDAIILINDIRLFQGDNIDTPEDLKGYTTVSQLQSAVRSIKKDSRFIIFGDIAIGICLNQPVEVSPILEACTISRTFNGENYNIDQVFGSERRITQTSINERQVLMRLHHDYRKFENIGVGGHFHLWKGLVMHNAADFSGACAAFEKQNNWAAIIGA